MRSPKLLGRCAGDVIPERANKMGNRGDRQDVLPCRLECTIDRGKMRLIYFHASVILHSEFWRAICPSMEALSISRGTSLISHVGKPLRQ